MEKQDVEATLEPLLAEPRTGKTVAYIHVPFCETHCLYCGFYNKAYREDESRIYADALIQELRLWRGRPGQDAGPVHAVYMGGGTPTALQADDLRRILKEVRAVLPLANDCEITVEGRLSNFGPDKMEACFEGGANRFSLGVQSFDTEIRQAMGRVSDRDTLIRQLQLLQSYDQAAVIVDLIYGFPMQTMDRWLADIATAQSLKLDGADCYQLNVYRNTPLAKAIESGRLPARGGRPHAVGHVRRRGEGHAERVLPPPLDQPLGADVAGTQPVQSVCQRPRPLSGVRSRRGRQSGRVLLSEPVGLPRVAGRSPGRTQAHRHAAPPVPAGQAVQGHRRGVEQGWLDMPGLEAAYGIPLGEVWKPVLEQWERAGLVERDGAFIVLTLAGQFWQVNLSQLLLDYLKRSLEA